MPIGIVVNCMSVLMGGLLGGLFGNKIPEPVKQSLPHIFGLCAFSLGVLSVSKAENITYVILSVILGAILGEAIGIEKHLSIVIKRLFVGGKATGNIDTITTAVVLFCFSGTAIFGALNEGFTGEATILLSKSVLDFFTAVIFASSAGVVLSLIVVPQFIILIALFFASTAILPHLSTFAIGNFSAVGGIITMAVGLKMLGLPLKPVAMLMALLIVLAISYGGG